MVENLQKPLLSHAWSAGFSFSKCHLEESVPYDPFTPYVMGVEQFARFARLWTRGYVTGHSSTERCGLAIRGVQSNFCTVCSYDVYTPTQNIVYHNYQANPDGHGPMEWLKPRFERFRQAALKRVRSYLELPNGLEGYNLANLGIYGLGKRRTLKQLAEFVRIDMATKSSRPESVRASGVLKRNSVTRGAHPFFFVSYPVATTYGSHMMQIFLQWQIFMTNPTI